MARMKMSRELALSKMRKLQDSLVGKFHGFCRIEYYCDEDGTYQAINFRIWLCDDKHEKGGWYYDIDWNHSNRDKFYPLWNEFEAALPGVLALHNTFIQHSNE